MLSDDFTFLRWGIDSFMGNCGTWSFSFHVLGVRLKMPRRPFLEGEAGGLGDGKGTSLGSWKLDRFGCWSKTAAYRTEECFSSTLKVSCKGVSGRLLKVPLSFGHISCCRASRGLSRSVGCRSSAAGRSR